MLLMKRFNVENLVKDHSNILIGVAKSVDKKVTSIKSLKHWQKLKVHKIFLA